MSEKSKEKLTTDLVEKVQNLNEKEKIEEIVQDNKIEFEVKKQKYRVSKPTNKQSQEVRKARTKKFYELLKNSDYKLKEVLIKELKEQGYDIIAKEEEIKELGYTIEDIQEKLAPLPTENKEAIGTYKKEIEELKTKQTTIANRVIELEEFSIEQELLSYSNLYLIYAVLEKLDRTQKLEDDVIDDNKWVKCFENYEEFLNSDNDELILSATYNMSMLVFRGKL